MTFRIVAEPRRWLVKIIVDSSEYVSAASSKGRGHTISMVVWLSLSFLRYRNPILGVGTIQSLT